MLLDRGYQCWSSTGVCAGVTAICPAHHNLLRINNMQCYVGDSTSHLDARYSSVALGIRWDVGECSIFHKILNGECSEELFELIWVSHFYNMLPVFVNKLTNGWMHGGIFAFNALASPLQLQSVEWAPIGSLPTGSYVYNTAGVSDVLCDDDWFPSGR